MSFEELPAGWTVWSDDGGRAVVVFRPDVFEGEAFDAARLPTIYVSTRPPDVPMRRGGDSREGWHVACTLEPEVRVRELESSHDTRDAAVAAAVAAARRFSAGEVDLEGVYAAATPERYVERLAALTGDVDADGECTDGRGRDA